MRPPLARRPSHRKSDDNEIPDSTYQHPGSWLPGPSLGPSPTINPWLGSCHPIYRSPAKQSDSLVPQTFLVPPPTPPFSHALEACRGSARPQKYPPRFAGLPSTGVLLFISLRSTLPRQYLRVSTSRRSLPSVSDNYPSGCHRVSSAEPQMNVAFSLWPTRANGQYRRVWPALGPGNFCKSTLHRDGKRGSRRGG